MSTYSVRCRNSSCRYRRVSKRHPDSYKLVPRCPECKERKGWRIEQRAYNRRDLCGCGQSPAYPHRKGKYKFCDHHPHGFYHQAKRQGASDDEIPFEYMPSTPMKETDGCPF